MGIAGGVCPDAVPEPDVVVVCPGVVSEPGVVVVCPDVVPEPAVVVVCPDAVSASEAGVDLHEITISVNNAINVNKENNFFIISPLLWKTGIIG
jgi:hypothetical protein